MADQETRRSRRTQEGERGRPQWSWYVYLLWYLSYALIWLLAKVCFRFRFTYGPEVQATLKRGGPILVLANHQSYLDPLFVLLALKARPLRFVVGYFLAHASKLQGLMKLLRAIPIQQFVADPTALRQILHALKNAETVLIFPEGQRSIDGGPIPQDYGVLRLAAKAEASVITVKLSGAYLAWPRWLQGRFRPGQVEAHLEVLAPAQAWPQHSLATWQEKLVRHLDYQDLQWAQAKGAKFLPGKKLKGLDLILHACPACGRAEVLKQEGWTLSCSSCASSFTFNSHYRLQEAATRDGAYPEDIRAWHLWQIAREGAAWQALLSWKQAESATPWEEVDPVLKTWLAGSRPEELAASNPPDQDSPPEDLVCLLPLTYAPVKQKGRGQAAARRASRLALSAESYYLELEKGFERLALRPGSLLMFSQGNYVQVKRGEEVLRLYPENPRAVIRLVDLALFRHMQGRERSPVN